MMVSSGGRDLCACFARRKRCSRSESCDDCSCEVLPASPWPSTPLGPRADAADDNVYCCGEEAFGAAMDKLATGSSFMFVVETVGSSWYDAEVERELKEDPDS